MDRKYIILKSLLIFTIALILYISFFLLICEPKKPTIRNYTYIVVRVYPHDPEAFTQGLLFDDGTLYESTGLYKRSTLRRVELETGRVLQIHNLPNQFFGEGITIFNDKIIQLTWRSNKGFVYDKISFDILQEFNYPTEGWGLTNNGTHLIMSDGTATLHFLDPTNFKEVGQIEVYDDGPVTNLNELEYIQGEIFANIWQEDSIARIDSQTGRVVGWIDLSSIIDFENKNVNDVLNGIAYDEIEDRLFVTGKRWSLLFEIRLIPLEE
jgi:glutamine cyclotransferase